MLDPLKTIQRFVDGTLPPSEFRDALYADESFETLLTQDPDLPATHYVRRYGGTYYFLIAQNYDDPGGVLNAHGALCEYMDRNGIAYSKSNKYSEFYNLVLEAAPNWLAPDHKFVAEHIMPDAGGRYGGELRAWLSQRLVELFKCADKPPEWIQSPCWPINENSPLVFLGQMEINNYFHDLANAYVFHDPASGKTETVIQVY
jgi:hypothetical protein